MQEDMYEMQKILFHINKGQENYFHYKGVYNTILSRKDPLWIILTKGGKDVFFKITRSSHRFIGTVQEYIYRLL